MKYLILPLLLLGTSAHASCERITEYLDLLGVHSTRLKSGDAVLGKERALISLNAHSLILLAGECPTQVKADGDERSAMRLQYLRGEVAADVMSFDEEGSIVSWARTMRNGTSSTHNF